MAITATSGAGNPIDRLQDAMNPPKKEEKDEVTALQDRFMKLLITQMKNQDPLSPMENSEFTTQMAQLQTVTGISNLNKSMGTMTNSYQASQTVQASLLIGRSVLAPGNLIELKSGHAVLGVDMAESAESVVVDIKSGGKVVASLDLGSATSGTLPLEWDGKDASGRQLADGEYTFEVKATTNGVERKVKDPSDPSGAKEIPAAKALMRGYIGSVSTNAQGLRLNATGFDKPLTMDDVRQIL